MEFSLIIPQELQNYRVFFPIGSLQTNEGVKFFRLKNHEREARVIFPEKLDDFICLQGTLREMPDNFEARVVFGGLFFRPKCRPIELHHVQLTNKNFIMNKTTFN